MAKQTINVGTVANDGTGDTPRDGMIKVNENFTELYDGKQATLVSGTNIKTVNGTSVLGAGDIVISGGSGSPVWGAITGSLSSQTDLQTALNARQPLAAVLSDTTAAFTTAQETKLSGIAAGATVNAANSALRDRTTHTGVQSLDTTTDSATRLAMTAAERTKLTGVATGATANSADATLLARANHTGTQAASTISDFSEAVDDRVGSLLVAGTNVTLTYNDAGNALTIAASGGGGGSSDPLNLATTNPAAPPAGTVRLFRREIAGKQFPAFVGSTGIEEVVQPFLGHGKIGRWVPQGNATTVGLDGLAAPTVQGTVTNRGFATTNRFTRTRRVGYVSAASAGSLAAAREGRDVFTLGDGAGNGGFLHVSRFGFSALTSDTRAFFGMRADSTASNVEPSTLTNCIGVGRNAADTNLEIFYGGSSEQTPIDLGASFPANTTNVDIYELALYAPSTVVETVYYQVTRLNTGDVVTGTLTGGAAVLPTVETRLSCGQFWICNNATASAVAFDLVSLYTKTDY